MQRLTIPENVFLRAINILEGYSKSQEAALKNTGQSQWLLFSDSVSSKDDLLKDLDRTDLNKKYIDVMNNASNRIIGDIVVLTLQNDFVGAIARDYYDIRRSRLTRLAHQSAVHRGRVGGDGTLNDVMLKYVESLTIAK